VQEPNNRRCLGYSNMILALLMCLLMRSEKLNLKLKNYIKTVRGIGYIAND
jgi:DNA-binding response OmpR family regulator